NKYCPQTEIKKMEDEFYNPIVKGNDLKTYTRRFQESNNYAPKRTSKSATPAMTEAAIWQLITEGVAAVLKAQAAAMANADNPNRNPRPRETSIAKRGNYKES
nr:reverse transcriptase domain-containing protein [Tanacetum cinerariifolium]